MLWSFPMAELLYEDLTYQIKGAYFKVFRSLPHHYPELFYEKAMYYELEQRGLRCWYQKEYSIFYEEKMVGKHVLDAVVEDKIVLEYKVAEALLPLHKAQLISYLKVSGHKLGFLMNFGDREPQDERVINIIPETVSEDELAETSIRQDVLYPDLSLKMIRALQRVFQTLGTGYVYRVYSNAFYYELQRQDVAFVPEKKIEVCYEDRSIGQLTFHHFVVEEKLAVFTTTINEMSDMDAEMLKQWMKHKGIRLGIVANFQGMRLGLSFLRV